MKIYHYTLVLLALLCLGSCSKDKGNYDYIDINELKISGVNPTYTLLRNIDTLRIKPVIAATMDESDPLRYDYLWVLRATINLVTVTDTIGRERNLEFPVLLEPVPYDLFYRVRDKKTGVEWSANSKLTIGTPYSRGLLLMGEDEQGYAEAEMLSMLSDTIHLKHILSESGLPRLREPLSFLHTGGDAIYSKVWAFSGSGSYYLDRITMKATTGNTFSKLLYTSENIDPTTLQPIAVAPQIRLATGQVGSTLYRAMLTKSGDIFTTFLIINGGDFYNNPVNRVSVQGERLPAAPYLLYSTLNMSSFVWYDLKNERFMNYTSFGLSTPSVALTDAAGSKFSWNQAPTGRHLVYAENTRNTDGGSTNGNSFAIMKDGANIHYVYKFYASGTVPATRDAYTILPKAIDFDKADFYAFSSNRSVIFYSVGNNLYAYDYNPGNEKFYQLTVTGGDQITMLKFDIQIDPIANSLYVGTYNSATKGTLRRFTVGTNPNVVELIQAPNGEWTDLIKVKDFNWRAVN